MVWVQNYASVRALKVLQECVLCSRIILSQVLFPPNNFEATINIRHCYRGAAVKL